MLSNHSPWGVMLMSCGMKLIAAADRATPAGELLHKQSMHHACSLLTCASANPCRVLLQGPDTQNNSNLYMQAYGSAILCLQQPEM